MKNLSISNILLWFNILLVLEGIFMAILLSLSFIILFYSKEFEWLLDDPLYLGYISAVLNIGFFALIILEDKLEDALFTKFPNPEIILEEEM